MKCSSLGVVKCDILALTWQLLEGVKLDYHSTLYLFTILLAEMWMDNMGSKNISFQKSNLLWKKLKRFEVLISCVVAIRLVCTGQRPGGRGGSNWPNSCSAACLFAFLRLLVCFSHRLFAFSHCFSICLLIGPDSDYWLLANGYRNQ